jgi:hypothetical protein
MSFPKDDNELDAALSEAFAPPPEADFDAWQRQHPESTACLNPRQIATLTRRRRMANRTLVFATTAAVAVLAWIGLSHFDTTGTGTSAFAQAMEQIQKAKDITWTDTVYCLITSKDGRRHWYEAHVFKNAYKAPGLYRTTALDAKGNVEQIEISDAAQMKVLTLYPSAKSAMMAEVRPNHDAEGPFRDARQAFRDPDLQFLKKQKTPAGDVNVFRLVESPGCFFDYWIDQKSKQLVEYRINQNKTISLADYENDPMRDATPEKEVSRGAIVGSITKDIVYNADLDNSLFRLDVPKGYTIETKKRHLVTEQEMIDFIRVLADFNHKVFPDEIADVPCDGINKYQPMPKAKRPPQAQKLIETANDYKRLGVRGLPLREFLSQHGAWSSFRYLGKGVKLGDKDAIVCWYKLKDAKNPNTYRVVYGDLSVKDVAPEDLPLPVGP